MSGTTWTLVFCLSILLAILLNLRLWWDDRKLVRRAVERKSRIPKLESPNGKLPRVSFLVAGWNEKTMIERFT